MTRRTKTPWTPGPDRASAFDRLQRTAHLCAVSLFGEKPRAEDSEIPSPRALMMEMAMTYFLCRIDPNDARTFWSEDGPLPYQPFPADYMPSTAPFASIWPPDFPAYQDILPAEWFAGLDTAPHAQAAAPAPPRRGRKRPPEGSIDAASR